MVISRDGPTDLTLAGESALGGHVAMVERRAGRNRVGSRRPTARTIAVLDQRGVAGRLLSWDEVTQVAAFAWIRSDKRDHPTRHAYGLALGQTDIERT